MKEKRRRRRREDEGEGEKVEEKKRRRREEGGEEKSSEPRNADRIGRRQRESGCHSSASGNKTSDVKLSVTFTTRYQPVLLGVEPHQTLTDSSPMF